MVRKSREIGAGPLPSVVHLLTQLKVKNQQRNEDGPYRGFFPQLLKSPENLEPGIPSLAKGIYVPPSPMIRVRFETVGRWVNAAFGQTWLGIGDMKKAWSSTMIEEQIELRLADWPNSPLRNHPPELTSLFGLDPELRRARTPISSGPRPRGRNPRFCATSATKRKSIATWPTFWSVSYGRVRWNPGWNQLHSCKRL